MYANQVNLNANYTTMICNMQHIYNEMQDANAYLPTYTYLYLPGHILSGK
jgi:hypothetical protein